MFTKIIALLALLTSTANAAYFPTIDNIIFNQISTPANPATLQNKIYTKSDNNLYILTSAGVEKQLGYGSVSSVSVVSANGFAGSVATSTTTPAITISTTVTGVLKGNGTAISAATSGTDYSAGTSALATGILKSTTTTGSLSIAVAGDFPTLNQNTTGTAALATSIAGGAANSIPYQSGAGVTTFLAQGTGVLQETAGTPSFTTTPTLTGTNFSGTAASLSIGGSAPAGSLTGATLAAGVTASSLTSVGTISTGVWNGTTIAIANGGTGQTTKAAAFDALSPMTTGGDLIYGGASGTGTRLANGSSGQVLQSNGGTAAPTWVTPTGGGTVTSVTFTGDGTVLSSTPSSAVTTTGTVTASLNTQTARTFLSGPQTGAAAAPTFKALVQPTYQSFTTTGTASGKLFALTTSPTVSAGATYTNNSVTYTVTYALAANTPRMYASGTGTTSGTTLTKTSGTGPSTLTFSGTPINTATYTTPSNPAPLYIIVRAVGGGGGGGPGGGINAGSTGGSGTPTVFGGIFCGSGTGGNAGSTTVNGTTNGSGSANFLLANFTSILNLDSVTGGDGDKLLSGTLTTNGGLGGRSGFIGGVAGTGTSYGDGGGGNIGGSTVYPGGGASSGGYFEGISTTLLSSYPYAIGTAGAGGTPGSSGNAGLDGQIGKVIVEEHYQ